MRPFLLMLLFAAAASADDCQDWAKLVDGLVPLTQEERKDMTLRWAEMSRGDIVLLRKIYKAYHFASNGGTSDEAWRQCVSY